MSFKDVSYLEPWQLSCLAERNHLGNFGRGHYENNFCEIILNLDQWLRSGSRFKKYLIWRSGGQLVRRSGTI